jgi:cytochrome c-type biogenesis protein CcsB
VASETVAQLSNNLLYSAMVIYALAMFCYAAELAFAPRVRRVQPVLVGGGSSAERLDHDATADGADRSDRVGRVAVSLTTLGFGLHLGAVVARGVSAGRAPWGNMFEFSVTGSLAVTAVFLLLLARRSDVRYLGLFVMLPVLLTLGLAVTVLYTKSEQLVPALKSVWLLIHVTAAIIASGIFTIGFAQTICYLVQERRERVPAELRSPSFMDRLPPAAALDRAAYRMHAFAFPIWTFAVIAGAIWAENAWGRYWGWDPKETWAFITWMVYACYLHARATAGWRGRKAAYVALFGYGTFLFNYLVVNIWLVGFHSYAGVG